MLAFAGEPEQIGPSVQSYKILFTWSPNRYKRVEQTAFNKIAARLLIASLITKSRTKVSPNCRCPNYATYLNPTRMRENNYRLKKHDYEPMRKGTKQSVREPHSENGCSVSFPAANVYTVFPARSWRRPPCSRA
jgi:hypothetical protein